MMDVDIEGHCPMGCGKTLFVGVSGRITCGYVQCPRPNAVDKLLADREIEHLVTFDEQGFTIRHPLRERLDEQLMTCDLHKLCASLPGPPPQLGTYRVRSGPTGEPWATWDAIKAPA